MRTRKRGASMCRARVRGREANGAHGSPDVMAEREGCPINGVRCRVLVPTMPVESSSRQADKAFGGISVGLHPEWLELDEGLTPLLHYDFEKRSRSNAWFLASM
jgi:hypothetical protein